MKEQQVKRLLHILTAAAACSLISCSTDDMRLQQIFIDTTHSHTVEIQHSHENGDTPHTHNTSEYLPEVEILVETPVLVEVETEPEPCVVLQVEPEPEPEMPPTNPFEDLLVASERILDIDGGRELLEIAVLHNVSEDKKIRMILDMPDSQAKQLLILAYADNEARVLRLQEVVERAARRTPR